MTFDLETRPKQQILLVFDNNFENEMKKLLQIFLAPALESLTRMELFCSPPTFSTNLRFTFYGLPKAFIKIIFLRLKENFILCSQNYLHNKIIARNESENFFYQF